MWRLALVCTFLITIGCSRLVFAEGFNLRRFDRKHCREIAAAFRQAQIDPHFDPFQYFSNDPLMKEKASDLHQGFQAYLQYGKILLATALRFRGDFQNNAQLNLLEEMDIFSVAATHSNSAAELELISDTLESLFERVRDLSQKDYEARRAKGNMKSLIEGHDLFSPPYGYLKRNGKLITLSVLHLLMKNSREKKSFFADTLHITISEFDEWLEQKQIHFEAGVVQFRSSSLRHALVRYRQQTEVIDAVIQFIRTEGFIPSNEHFHKDRGPIFYSFERVKAQHRYAPGSKFHHLRIFNSAEDYWVALKIECDRLGIPFELSSVSYDNVTSRTRYYWQKEAVDRFLNFYVQEGRLPTIQDFAVEAEGDADPTGVQNASRKLKLIRNQLFGHGAYGKNRKGESDVGAFYERRIFDTASDAWLAIGEEAARRGIPFSYLKIRFGHNDEISPELLSRMQEEAVINLVNHRLNAPAFMNLRTWDTNAAGASLNRLVLEVFSSPWELWKAVENHIIQAKNLNEGLRAEMLKELAVKFRHMERTLRSARTRQQGQDE